jgi:hypothetical protein
MIALAFAGALIVGAMRVVLCGFGSRITEAKL